MRTLLCAINSKYIHSAPSIYLLEAAARGYQEADPSASYGTLMLEEYSINQPYEAIYYNILQHQPDVVAFSVYIWNITYIQRLCHDLKAVRPSLILILGGPEVSSGIEHTRLTDADYDYIIEGEGERAFYALLMRLKHPRWQPPVSWNYIDYHHRISCSPIMDLDELPMIYTEDTIDRFRNRILYYESSRGCPFRCSYCLSGSAGPVRELSLERTFRDLAFFIHHEVPQVKFVDRTFNCRPERARRIIEYIIDHVGSRNMNFHFEVAGDLFTPELLKELSRAPKGLFQMEIGIQSTYEPALRASVRTASFDRIRTSVNELLAYRNIHLHVDLIAGLAYETLPHFRNSFNDVYRLHAHQLQLGFLKKLRGAPLEATVDEHQYIFSEEAPYEILQNRYITPLALLELKKIEDVVDRYYNSGRFTRILAHLEDRFGSPYDLYSELSALFDQHGYHFLPLHSHVLYDVLWELCENQWDASDCRQLLLYDFYASSTEERLPSCLSCFQTYRKENRERSIAILQQFPPTSRRYVVRLAGSRYYVFDYTERDPVTGRFPQIDA